MIVYTLFHGARHVHPKCPNQVETGIDDTQPLFKLIEAFLSLSSIYNISIYPTKEWVTFGQLAIYTPSEYI